MFSKKALLATAILLASTSSAHASWDWVGEDRILDLKVNVSTYYDTKDVVGMPTNDDHYGASVDYLVNKPNSDKHWLGLTGGVQLGQYDEWEYHAGGMYKYRINFDSFLDSIEVNLRMELRNQVYRMKENEAYEDERETRIAMYPNLTFNFTEKFNADITYITEDWSANVADDVEFLQIKFGYRF